MTMLGMEVGARASVSSIGQEAEAGGAGAVKPAQVGATLVCSPYQSHPLLSLHP